MLLDPCMTGQICARKLLTVAQASRHVACAGVYPYASKKFTRHVCLHRACCTDPSPEHVSHVPIFTFRKPGKMASLACAMVYGTIGSTRSPAH